VTYIYQRFESLMGLFFLLTLYCFVRSLDAPHPRRWLAASVAACLMGAGCKETIAMAPLVVLWYDRAVVASSWREIAARRKGYYAALFAVDVLVGLMIVGNVGKYQATGFLSGARVTRWQYLFSQPGVILHYLWLALWPEGLCLDYAWPVASDASAVAPPLVVLLLLGAVTLWAVWRWPAIGFLGGWFILCLAPTSSLVPIVDLAVEHRMYLPLAALAVLAAVGVYELLRALSTNAVAARVPGWRFVAAIGALAGALAVATVLRNRDYGSECAIWQDVVDKAPHNSKAHINLGIGLERNGKLEEAVAQFAQALQLDPQSARAHCNLANTLAEQHQFEAALRHYAAAIDIEPSYSKAYQNAAATLYELRRFDQAIALLERAKEVSPDDPDIYNSLGLCWAREGRMPQAIECFRQALKLAPGHAEVQRNLEAALRFDGASGDKQRSVATQN
jgi:tetratricopeptide (TPR) repeat protein